MPVLKWSPSSPEFGCVIPPESLPFGCTANVELGAGESRTHRVTIIIPGNGGGNGSSQTAPSTQQDMRNCVLVGEPAILASDIGGTLEGAATAQANEGSQRYACHDFLDVEERVAELCQSGMVLSKSTGNCECPSGTKWNGRRCFGTPTGLPPVTIPPVIDRAPVCPSGMDRFKSFKGKPLGYSLKSVRSNGRKIICGAPVCARGWKVYRNNSSIPKGWDRKRMGRPNSNYKFWCAKRPNRVTDLTCWSGWEQITADESYTYRKDGFEVRQRVKGNQSATCARPRRTPPQIQCWNKSWTKVTADEAYGYRQKGYEVKQRVSGRESITCVRPGTTQTPLQCWSSEWTKIWLGEINSYRKKGYSIKPRGKGKRQIWCAKQGTGGGTNITPIPDTFTCWNGWLNINRAQRSAYTRKGYQVKSRRKGKRRIWCAKKSQPAFCKGKNEFNAKGDCICKSGFKRNSKYQCVRNTGSSGGLSTTPGTTLTCWNSWTTINRSLRSSYTRKGYNVKSRRKGSKRIWCAKKLQPAFCTGKNELNAKGDCICKAGFKRNSKYKCVKNTGSSGGLSTSPGTTLTCWNSWTTISRSKRNSYRRKGYSVKSRGKGRKRIWCAKAVQRKTCAQSGKLGKYPNCYKKPVINYKPKKTCAQIGKLGKYPKCYKKPIINYKPKPRRKTCAQLGKLGKYPKCYKKPVTTFKPKPKRKTCAQFGKLGKYPKCYKKPVTTFKPKPKRKTCAQFGKLGKYPKCYKKPVKLFIPKIQFKPKG